MYSYAQKFSQQLSYEIISFLECVNSESILEFMIFL